MQRFGLLNVMLPTAEDPRRTLAGVRPTTGKYIEVHNFFRHCPPFVKPATCSLGVKVNAFCFVKSFLLG